MSVALLSLVFRFACAEGFSASNVDLTFGTPEDGKVKFTVGPKAGNADGGTFFMKVKMMP